MPARVLLVGGGAIGSFFAARLACAPNTAVSALCRSNYQVVKANGFVVTSPVFPTLTFIPEHTFRSSEEAKDIKWDYLLIATKALPDVSDDSTLLEGLVGPETGIVLVQNGVGIEEPYRKRFPAAFVSSATTIASVAQPSPGRIEHNRWTRISIGPYLPSESHESGASQHTRTAARSKTAAFVELLRQGGMEDAELHDHQDLQAIRWHKVAVNAAINPTSVLSGGCDTREMSTDPGLSEHLLAVMREVLETAVKVLGRPLPSYLGTPEQILKSTRKSSSGSMPSMYQDWIKGNKMEIEVILGNPLRKASQHGITTPRLQTIYALLKAMQDNRDKRTLCKM